MSHCWLWTFSYLNYWTRVFVKKIINFVHINMWCKRLSCTCRECANTGVSLSVLYTWLHCAQVTSKCIPWISLYFVRIILSRYRINQSAIFYVYRHIVSHVAKFKFKILYIYLGASAVESAWIIMLNVIQSSKPLARLFWHCC
jgi:hypothetical protein